MFGKLAFAIGVGVALLLSGDAIASHEDCSHGSDGSDIIGTDNNDVCNGTDVAENMYGKRGKDVFTSFGGWDDLHGQRGNDSMYESNGHGAVQGGLAHDRIHGNDGDDNVLDNAGETDEDHACDGRGVDLVDIADGDGMDTWFNYPDGEGEFDVQYDDTLGDNIANNRDDCPLPSRW